MASTGNVIAGVSHIPRVLVQKLKEELSLYAFNTPAVASVTKAANDKLDQCALILQEFQVREEAIQADALLSDEGKRHKMQATAKEFFGRLALIAEAVENRRQAAAELRKELDRLPKAPGEPLVEAMREKEIREELRKLDESARMKRLADSMKRKDLAILKAIENGPFGANEFVPDEYHERLREQLLETKQAAELTRWKALVFVVEKLQLLANVLETTLGKYRLDVPVFPGQSVRAVDLHQQNTQAPPDKNTAADRPPATIPAFQ
jgi:hypothetical protein